MVDFPDPYLIGLSLLLFYVLKTYFQARAVWKQLGSVHLLTPFSKSSLSFPFLRAVPGRCMLINEFSRLRLITGEVKYITPGANKGWREKHKGILLSQSGALVTNPCIGHSAYGWDIISTVRPQSFQAALSKSITRL